MTSTGRLLGELNAEQQSVPLAICKVIGFYSVAKKGQLLVDSRSIDRQSLLRLASFGLRVQAE